ncbi:MAG: OmpA family protein [Calditrichaeota bacterium]|nr:MAG: OmpA family protein [Calditrichota bacterium]MBL1204122.1 OmpA family protein [Calditrichota bacterium]NOG43953.1 OmpA family protein [Calditrichota bacterium]
MKATLISMLLVMSFVINGFSQTTAKDKFFADYESLIEQVRSGNGEILSPEFYKNAVEVYQEAIEAYEEKESQKIIREKLDESAKYARDALGIIKLANLTLKQTIDAREAALSAEAPIYAAKLWEEAEEEFREATQNLEDDDIDDAKEYGQTAQQLFNQSELLGIKNGILGEAREKVKLAEEAEAGEYSFHTLTDAQNLLVETERLLDGDRYAREEAIQKAAKASYQGSHAAYLAKTIKALSTKDENWENLILKFEEFLTEFGSQFNYKPQFDEGFDNSVRSISEYIKTLKEDKKQLIQENGRLQEELNSVKEREENYSAELEKKKDKERRIDKVKSLFSSNEAKVIYEGDNLIIRLFGINFPSGKAIIQPEYFSLLTKVQQALREFQDSHYLIEGHTDALGNNNRNKILSEKRALSVREYLIANMDLSDSQITHIGFGESKPVASNETRQGRELNRRIDVVINISE